MDFDNFDELTARRLMAHMSPYDRETLTTAGVDKSFADGELEKGTKVGRAMQSPKKTAWQRMGAKEAEIDAKAEVEKYKVERPRILDKPHSITNISDKVVRYRPMNVEDKKSLGELVDLVKAILTGLGRNPAKVAADLTQLRERVLSRLGGVPATIKPITAERFQKPEEKKKKVEHVNPRTGAPALASSNAGLDVKRSVESTLQKAKETMASLDQARKNTEDRLASEKKKFTLAAPPKPLEDLSGAKGVDTTDEYKLHLSKARDFMESFKKSTSGTFGVRAIGKLTQDLREE